MCISKDFIFFSIIFYLHVDGVLGSKQCPMSCKDRNEEYAVDAKRPQNTCANYGCYDQIQCPGSSTTGDCYCKEGYARRFKNGPSISITNRCCARVLPVTPEDCQKRENEVYNEYAGYRACENTCQNYELNCGTINTLVATWRPWCDCVEGYARLPNGTCVSVSDPCCSDLYKPSKVQCQLRGEVYRVGEICESIPSCEYPNGPPYVCLAIGPMERCYCREGYLRNSDGVCVPEDEC